MTWNPTTPRGSWRAGESGMGLVWVSAPILSSAVDPSPVQGKSPVLSELPREHEPQIEIENPASGLPGVTSTQADSGGSILLITKTGRIHHLSISISILVSVPIEYTEAEYNLPGDCERCAAQVRLQPHLGGVGSVRSCKSGRCALSPSSGPPTRLPTSRARTAGNASIQPATAGRTIAQSGTHPAAWSTNHDALRDAPATRWAAQPPEPVPQTIPTARAASACRHRHAQSAPAADSR